MNRSRGMGVREIFGLRFDVFDYFVGTVAIVWRMRPAIL